MSNIVNLIKKPIVLVFIIVIFLFINWILTFKGLYLPDAAEYSQIASLLNKGEFFKVLSFTPIYLNWIDDFPPPDLLRAPLHPLVLSIFFRFFGEKDIAAGIESLIFVIVTIFITYKIINIIIPNNTYLAVLACFILCTNKETLAISRSGMSEPLFATLLSLMIYLFLINTSNSRKIIGLIAGLLYLCRYLGILYLLPLFIILKKSLKRKSLLFIFICFLICITPWIFRNYLETGNPFFSIQKYEIMMFSSTYPGYSLYKSDHLPSIFDFMFSNYLEIIKIYIRNIVSFINDIPKIWRLTITFVLISTLFIKQISKKSTLIYFTLLVMLLHLFILPIHYVERVFYPLLILIIPTAIIAIHHFLLRKPIIGFMIISLILLEGTSSYIFDLRKNIFIESIEKKVNGNYNSEIFEHLRATVPQGQLVISCRSFDIGWYAKCMAMEVPLTPDTFYQINKKLPEVFGLLLPSDENLIGKLYWQSQELEEWAPFIKKLRVIKRYNNGWILFRLPKEKPKIELLDYRFINN